MELIKWSSGMVSSQSLGVLVLGPLGRSLEKVQVSPCLDLAWCHLVRIIYNLLLVPACARFGGVWVKLCSEWRLAATIAKWGLLSMWYREH